MYSRARRIILPAQFGLFSLLTFALILFLYPLNNIQAQFATPNPDGTVNANEYGNHTNGVNRQVSGGQNWYMTWDNTNLYIAVEAANNAEALVLYLDANPQLDPRGGTDANGNLTGQAYDNTNFSGLPFRADLVLYVKNGYSERRTANGTGGWSTATTPGVTAGFNAANREFSLPWSSVGGRPAAFNWFGYITSASGFIFGEMPAANPSGSLGTTINNFNTYYSVLDTNNGTSTAPFSLQTFTVNSTTDTSATDANTADDYCATASGVCSLRAAIQQSNATAGTNLINFNLSYPATVTLTSALPSINSSIIVVGSNPNNVIINGANSFRHFGLNANSNLDLQNLRLVRGNAVGSFGGAIFGDNINTLNLTNVTFENNISNDGGAIRLQTGAQSVTISNSTFISNTSTDIAGAINFTNAIPVTISNSSFISNTNNGAYGAAIANFGATLNINNSTFQGNFSSGYGGAIANYAGTFNISNSSFTANRGNDGGAIANFATLTASNVTFTNNTATVYAGALLVSGDVGSANANLNNVTFTNNVAGYAGGLMNSQGGQLTLNNATFNNNRANNDGGGLRNVDAGSVLTVTNSIFTGNTANNVGAIETGSNARILLASTIISNNTATNSSGGIAVIGGSQATISNTTFISNTSTNGNGGAMGAGGNAQVSIADSNFTNNKAQLAGGGLRNDGGAKVTITNTTFDNNTGDRGGGILSSGSGTIVTVTNTSFANNRATTEGGALADIGGSVTNLTNSTIYSNTAPFGGGIVSNSALNILNTTVVSNTAGTSGGGIRALGTTNLKNTLIADNVAPSGLDFSGSVTSGGNNFIANPTGGTGYIASDIIGSNPILGPFGNYKSSRQTIAPYPNGRAVDNGNNTGAPATDARGVARPQDGNNDGTATTDIGAHETVLGGVTITLTSGPNPSNVGQVTYFTATITTSSGFNATNRICFSYNNGANWLACTTPNSSGVASFGLAGLAQGSYFVRAAYPGDANNDAGISAARLHVVQGPGLTSISVTPATATIADGLTQQYRAIGTYSDGSTLDLTTSVTWASSNAGAATISNVSGSKGLATAVNPGTTNITATLSGITSPAAVLTVTNAVVQSAVITPSNPVVPQGVNQQFDAILTLSDGTTSTVRSNPNLSWATANPAIATINSSGLATSVAQGSTVVTATYNSVVATTTLFVTDARLNSITISPTNATAPVGTQVRYRATGTFSDGSTRDVTSSAVWATSNTTIAEFLTDPAQIGTANAKAVGTVSVTATLGTVSASTNLTVSAAELQSLAITPTNAALPDGQTLQYTAIGTFTDGSTQDLTANANLNWGSSIPGVATISNGGLTKGRATAVAPGMTVITASTTVALNSKTVTTTLTVTDPVLTSLAITPPNQSIPLGTTRQFNALGTLSDGSVVTLTTSVAWSSSNTAVATINTNGLAQGVGIGTVTITAASGNISATTQLTVTSAVLASIQVNPSNATRPSGTQQQFDAIGLYTDGSTQNLNSAVNWTVGNGAVASITITGLATAIAPGTTLITATSQTNPSIRGSATFNVTGAALESIQVRPASANVPRGGTQQYEAIGFYSDSTTQTLTTAATWTTDSSTVATVTNTGLAYANNVGTTQVRAAFGGKSGAATINVVAPTLQSISVVPANRTIAKGQTQSYIATGSYSDGSTQDITASVTWASSNPAIASISNAPATKGIATGNAPGTVTISATLGAVVGTGILNVTDAQLVSLGVTPTNATRPVGLTFQFEVYGTYSDNSIVNLTSSASWNSSNPAVATINSIGLATAVSPGSTTITATYGGVNSNPATFNVTNAALQSISVTPAAPVIARGTSQQFAAIGSYSDGTTQTLTTVATWQTGNAAVATINATGLAASPNNGLTGSTIVTATSGTISGTAILYVTAAELTGLTITPTNATIVRGETRPLVAIGQFSDGTTQELTSQAAWQSGNPAIASVSNAAGTRGQVTGIAANPASVTITATRGGFTATASVVVTRADTSVNLTANPPGGVPAGDSVTFTATVSAVAPGSGFPSGEVVFKDGANPVFTATLSAGGVATFTTSALSAGQHTINADYKGDANYNPSTRGISYTIGAANATITLTITPTSPVFYGQVVTLVATATTQSGPLTSGMVNFTTFATLLGTANLDASGVATFTVVLPAGSYSLRANLPGSPGVSGSQSNPVNYLVNPANTATTLNISPASPSVFGTSVTFSATVTNLNTSATPTGTVTFLNGATPLFTGTVGANGVATYVTNTLPVGTYNLTARYEGTPNFVASTSPAQNYQIVAGAAQQIFISVTPTSTTAGNSLNVTVQVRDGAGNLATGFTGTVSFTASDPQASVPINYTFTAADGGSKTFPAGVTFRTAGVQSLTVTSGALSATQNGIVVQAGPPATVVPTVGSGQGTAINTPFPRNLEARVLDGFNNPIAGQVVTFTAPASGASGSFGASGQVYIATTNVSGYVTATTFTANAITGTYSVLASIGSGSVNPANFALTNNDGTTACNPFIVTQSSDNGVGSCGTLSFALSAAAGTPNANIIFSTSLTVINVTGALPPVPSGTTLDAGCTIENGRGAPKIQLKAIGISGDGLKLSGNSTVRGLAITNFGGWGVEIGGTGNQLLCNYIGTADGINFAPNGGGVRVLATAGGTKLGANVQPDSGNLISGNTGTGLLIETGSTRTEMAYTFIGYQKGGTLKLLNARSLDLKPGAKLVMGLGNRIAG
jgi:trimeric autotransporter adhesin